MTELIKNVKPDVFAGYIVLMYILVVCSFYDIRERMIPDRFLAAGVLARLMFILASESCQIKEALYRVSVSAAGGLITALMLLAVVLVLERSSHKKMMGGGDIKLLFTTGMYLGYEKNLYVLLLACVFGLAHGLFLRLHDKDEMMTFSRGRTEMTRISPEGGFPWAPSIAFAVLLVIVSSKNT